MKKIAFFFIGIIMLASCEVLEQVLEVAAQQTAVPTDSEVVEGLKKALEIGTDYAVSNLHKKDGYYANKVVKILLPPEVQKPFDAAMNNNTVKKLGLDKVLQQKTENFLLAVNRSAEQAAIDAKPIFIDAIKNLTITQGMSILKGSDLSGKVSGFDSLAATHYLEYKTRKSLYKLFEPKMKNTLDKDLGVGFSANQAWNSVITYYNSYVATVLGKQKINYTLTEYATNKALDGLFYMMGQEEKKIRKDPYKYAYDIIKKVFGYVFRS